MFGIQQFLVIGSTSKYITTDHYLTSLVCTQIVVYKIFIILCRDRHHHWQITPPGCGDETPTKR